MKNPPDDISARYVRAVRNARPRPAPTPSHFGASLRFLFSVFGRAVAPALLALTAALAIAALYLSTQS